MSPRFNFWFSLFFTIINLYFWFESGGIINLGLGLFCGWQTYRLRDYA